MAEVTAAMVKELREITGVGMMECKKALSETQGDMEAAKEYLRKTGQAKALKKSSRETKEGAIGMYMNESKTTGALVRIACETDFVAKNSKFQSFLVELATQASIFGAEDLLSKASLGGGTLQEKLHALVGELGENLQFVEAKSFKVNEGVLGGYIHSNGKIGVMVQLETAAADGAVQDLAKDLSMHIAATHAEAINEDQIDPKLLEKEKEILMAQAQDSGKPQEIIEKMVMGRIKKFMKEVCVISQPFVKNPEKTIADLLNDISKKVGKPVKFTAFAKFQF